MQKHPHLLVVIADGGHARFVRPAADHALRTETRFDSALSYHAYLTRRGLMTPEKAEFGHLVATELNAIAAQGGFESLLIVAPPHVEAAIIEKLDGTVQAKIVGRLAKDLVKTPDEDLWPHLREWVDPVHRAAL